jgi:hypothetical protein
MKQLISGTVTPAWLTETLARNGFPGQVARIRATSTSAFTASITRLELSYAAGDPAPGPARLLLKLSAPGAAPGFGEKEVQFHTLVADAAPDLPVARCYDAAHCRDTGRSHLLFEDLSQSHFQTQSPLPPVRLNCQQAVDALAQFHAFWWKHPRLGQDIGEFPTPEAERQYVRELRQTFPGFADMLGDRLSPARRKLYEQYLAALPRLERHARDRLREGKGLTLAHGDAHPWNFLFPHDPEQDTARIIDWQFWGVRVGAGDLARFMALNWYPERRQALERGLVRRYHDGLLERGVGGYGWDDCWHDYRLAVIDNLSMPVWQWAGGALGPEVWWDKLEKAVLAFEDLGCAELL